MLTTFEYVGEPGHGGQLMLEMDMFSVWCHSGRGLYSFYSGGLSPFASAVVCGEGQILKVAKTQSREPLHVNN